MCLSLREEQVSSGPAEGVGDSCSTCRKVRERLRKDSPAAAKDLKWGC